MQEYDVKIAEPFETLRLFFKINPKLNSMNFAEMINGV
jgi:hypothetical protein